MITEEKIEEIFEEYANKDLEENVEQLKEILSELSKEVSKKNQDRLNKFYISLDFHLNNYTKAYDDKVLHIPGADKKLQEAEYVLRDIIYETKSKILELAKSGEDIGGKKSTYGSWTLNGKYITHYEEWFGGQKEKLWNAPATIKQKGLEIEGETTQLGRRWILKGKFDDIDGFVDGKYYAENPIDKGRGYFFLKIDPIDRSGDLDGYWIGYDSQNKRINGGRYLFKRIPEIQIQPITPSCIPKILTLASSCLGEHYIPVISQNEINKNPFLVAISSKKLIGFAHARMVEKDELNAILKNQFSIPADIKRAENAGTLGLLKTVCVDEDYRNRGVATILVKDCLNKLIKLGADTLICIAWKSSKGVHIGGILSNLGFIEWETVEKFWHEDSIKRDYKCPICKNPPCNCSAVLYSCTDFSKIMTSD